MENFKISVPSPCHENWDKMRPEKEGRYCNSCDKIVVDFTKMSPDEIKQYFFNLNGRKVCGHFRNSQVKEQEVHFLLKWKDEFRTIQFQPLKYLAVGMVGLMIALVGCRNETTEGEPSGYLDTVYPADTQKLTGIVGIPPIKGDLPDPLLPPDPSDTTTEISGEVAAP